MRDRAGSSTSAVVFSALLLVSCANTLPAGTSDETVAGIVNLALTTTTSELVRRAADNDAGAQYALSIVYEHGLGAPVDPVLAELWRAQALGARGVMPITQYTPAFEGAPSRVNLIYIPRHDLDLARANTVDLCIDALASGQEAAQVCGAEGVSSEALGRQWSLARSR